MPNTQFRWDATIANLQTETGMVAGEVGVIQGYASVGDGGGGVLFFESPTSATISGATNTSPIVVTTGAAHGLTAGAAVMIAGVAGNTAANGRWFIPSFPPIMEATNANPIEITTGRSHGLTNGQQISIEGVVGNTAANGTWTVGNVTATTFTLNSSNGNGTYSSGGTFTALASQIVSNATNASPIVVTTQAAHALANGLTVTIVGVLGNTAANGTRAVANVTATTFELSISGNGAYTSGGIATSPQTFVLKGSTGNAAYSSGGAVGDGGTTIPSSATAGRWHRIP